ncbi:MAG: hypothetical protein HYZ28_23750 [Myxococcales bacterium]|nr:hypothetical protein [Myxococcales bacterium]
MAALSNRLLRAVSENRLLTLVAAVYLFAFPYHPALRSPNELCRLWQARALVEHRTIQLNEAMRDFGSVGDLSVKDGRYYPSKAPLLSFLAAPIYAIQKAFGTGALGPGGEVPQVFWSRLFLTVLPTLAALVLIRRFLCAHCSREVAEGMTATYALGSLAFSYSLLFMSHQTTAVLLFCGFYGLWRIARGEWRERGYLAVGACAGAAIAAEYTAALGVAGLLAYGAHRALRATSPDRSRGRWTVLARGAFLAAAGALPFVAFLGIYHQAAFGHPLESGYKYLADAGYQPWHLGGFLGIRLPEPRAFALSFFSPLRGLFTLSPFLLISLPGLWLLFRDSRGDSPAERELRGLFWLSAVLLASYAYFTSSFSYESWGWTTGPRHLTPLVPFLLLPAARFLDRLRGESSLERRMGLGLLAAACAGSVLVTGMVSLVDYVPDVASNALFGLAVPLFREGYLPPSVLSLMGLPNPWSGAPLVLAVMVAAGWVGWKLVGEGREAARGQLAPAAWAAVLAFSVYLGLLAAATRGDSGDLGAQAHLKSVWSAPP